MVVFLLCVFIMMCILFAKNHVTLTQQTRISDAIYMYHMQLIKEGRLNESQVDYSDIEHYDKTMLRLWDWGPTRILSPEKYEIIKPYIIE